MDVLDAKLWVHSTNEKPSKNSFNLGATMATVSLVFAMIGLTILALHAQTPGLRVSEVQIWPGESSLPHDSNHPTLLVFLHPHCPCSAATLSELEVLLSNSPPVRTVVSFVIPDDREVGWRQGANWHRANALKGVEVRVDRGGAESRRFGAATSGHVCLYRADGCLRFTGGITSSRGHVGENLGRKSIETWLARGESGSSTTPVYGCPLFSP